MVCLVAHKRVVETLGWLLVLGALFWGQSAMAGRAAAPPGDNISMGERAWILKDDSGRLSLAQVITPPWSQRFEPNGRGFLRAGSIEGALWVRLPLPEDIMAGTSPQDWFLELGKLFVNRIDFFLPLSGGGWHRIRGGMDYPSGPEMAVSRVPAVRFPADLDPTRPILVRMESHFGLGMPLILRQEKTFHRQVMADSYLYGLLYGAPLALALFNLFVFISLRDRVYLYYVIFILSLLGYQIILHGQSGLLDMLSPRASLLIFGLLAGVSFFFAGLFSKAFLLTRRHAPLWDRALSAYMALAVVRGLLSVAGMHEWGNHLAQFMALAGPVLSIAVGTVVWRRGFKPAIYYVVAWAGLSICVVWHVLVSFSWLPWDNISSMMMGVGAALEATLLSFALADRIRALRQERESLALATRQLHRLSNLDELTGLFNARHFRQQLPILVGQAQDQNQPLSLIMLDIDDFKLFNDTYGHPQGDQVLACLGRVISQLVRGGDLACRYGGEEFAIILPGAELPQASMVAERIRQQFALQIFRPRPAEETAVTASLGLAQMRPNEESSSLLQRADQELYRAKESGKNMTMVAS